MGKQYQQEEDDDEQSWDELIRQAALIAEVDRLFKKPKIKLIHAVRRNREKAIHMNVGYALFLVVALVIAALVLIGYINLQSEITGSVKNLSKMKSQLHTLRQENDEYEAAINRSVDLEEVRRIAICELGMKYASEGQIVQVEGGGDDYARKYANIPEE